MVNQINIFSSSLLNLEVSITSQMHILRKNEEKKKLYLIRSKYFIGIVATSDVMNYIKRMLTWNILRFKSKESRHQPHGQKQQVGLIRHSP